jgi:hypothetical protein
MTTQELVRELITLLITGGVLWLLIQFTGLKFWHTLLAFGAAFYLAIYTPAGSQVSDQVSRILAAFGH